MRMVFVHPKRGLISNQQDPTTEQTPQRAMNSWSLEASKQKLRDCWVFLNKASILNRLLIFIISIFLILPYSMFLYHLKWDPLA